MAQDPISGILLPTDENIGSRMKTCLSIIDSYDEIMDFIFPPNLSFFYDEFRVGAWDMFLSQLKVLHWSGFVGWNRWLEQMVGTDGWRQGTTWAYGPNLVWRGGTVLVCPTALLTQYT